MQTARSTKSYSGLHQKSLTNPQFYNKTSQSINPNQIYIERVSFEMESENGIPAEMFGILGKINGSSSE
jgi:hypothetical protein